jgi:lipopolysaccharide biosynthesis glycosyltransferase
MNVHFNAETQMQESIHVMLASDGADVAGLAVAGYSAVQQTSRAVALWVVQQDFDHDTMLSLRKFWAGAEKVQFLTMKSLPWWWATPNIPLLSWARIQITELLPSSVSRCIYLDTDTLVGRDLSELFDMPLYGKPIAMAINDKMTPQVNAYVASLGINPDYWYNAGVALIDLDAWRRESEMEGMLISKRSMPTSLWFNDQDLINKHFAGRVLTLDLSWNRRDAAYSPDGQILHLAGKPKPWEMTDDGDSLPGVGAWLEVSALWGRKPVPKRRSMMKLRAASAMRHLVTFARKLSITSA